MEEFEKYRSEIIEKINSAKDEIINLKEYIETNKRDVEEVRAIINKLRQVETSLRPKQKLLKERIEALDLILEELLGIRRDITLTMLDEVFEIIDRNLIDGMFLEYQENNENLRNIIFDEEKVGYIEVTEVNTGEIKIKVKVYDSSDQFDLSNPRRMYSIISFINTKFNYKET